MRFEKKITLYFLMSMGTVASAAVPFSSSLLRGVEIRDSLKMLPGQRLFENPALHYYKEQSTLSELFVGWEQNNRENRSIPQLGSGDNLFGVQANSFIRSDSKSCIWGKAAYENGKREDVYGSETSDYLLLYPYVMADTIGGDFSEETYSFAGGYARRNNRFTWGADFAYRALREYRDRDPRPKNTVSDLAIGLGGAYELTARYGLGLSLNGRRYKQNNTIAFYNELGSPVVYHMSGLGVDYVRFAGNRYNTLYDGYGWKTALDLLPLQGTGWFARVGYEYFGFEKLMKDLNHLPLNRLKARESTFTGGYKGRKAGYEVTLSSHQRNGTENIFGDAGNNSYDLLASKTPYTGNRRIWKNTMNLQGDLRNNWRWYLSANGGLSHQEYAYREPNRELSALHSNVGATFRISKLGRSYNWNISTGGDLQHRLSGSFELGDLAPSSYFYRLIENAYSNGMGNQMIYHTESQLILPFWKEYKLYIKGRITLGRSPGEAIDTSISVTSGIYF